MPKNSTNAASSKKRKRTYDSNVNKRMKLEFPNYPESNNESNEKGVKILFNDQTTWLGHLGLIQVKNFNGFVKKSVEKQEPNNESNRKLLESSKIKDEEKRFEKICISLIKEKANPNFQDKNGFTALYYAVKIKDIKSAKLLLDNGADINLFYGKDFDTVLHISVKTDDVKMVELLIQHGANQNLENNLNQTPLMLAEAFNKEAVKKLLLSKIKTKKAINNKIEQENQEVLCDVRLNMPIKGQEIKDQYEQKQVSISQDQQEAFQ